MSGQHLNEAFELLVSVLPVMHKKIHRDVFKTAIEQADEDLASHHLMILKMLRDGGLLNLTFDGNENRNDQAKIEAFIHYL